MTLDGAPITPAIISGSLPSLHASVVPAIFVTEPVIEENKYVCNIYIYDVRCLFVFLLYYTFIRKYSKTRFVCRTHHTLHSRRLNQNKHWRDYLYVIRAHEHFKEVLYINTKNKYADAHKKNTSSIFQSNILIKLPFQLFFLTNSCSWFI